MQTYSIYPQIDGPCSSNVTLLEGMNKDSENIPMSEAPKAFGALCFCTVYYLQQISNIAAQLLLFLSILGHFKTLLAF